MLDSPIVIFEDDDIDSILAYFLGVCEEYVNSYFGIILSKLGFNNEDIVNVYKVYNYSEYTDLLFRVNSLDDEYRIRVSTFDNVLVINFIIDGKSCEYFCNVDRYGRFEVELIERYPEVNEVLNTDKITTDLELCEYEIINDEDIKELREDKGVVEEAYDESSSSKGYLNYRVVSGDYVVEISFYKHELYYGILNRSEVFKYLSTLKEPISIFDIYKKICEIARIENIRWFSYFDLRILKWKEDSLNDGDYEITDLITLSDGEVVCVMVTRDGKQVYSNNEDVWTCDMNNSEISFVTVRDNNSISFNTKVKFKEESIFNTEYLALEEMMNAKIEVAKVKKLAKETFCK